MDWGGGCRVNAIINLRDLQNVAKMLTSCQLPSQAEQLSASKPALFRWARHRSSLRCSPWVGACSRANDIKRS